MPTNIRQNVVFLVQERLNTVSGQSNRVACGTAFFVVVMSGEGKGFPYLVTARHSLELADKNKPLFVRYNTAAGFDDAEVKYEDWHQHPTTDVAILHFPPPDRSLVVCLPTSMLLSSEQVKKIPPKEGADVRFISLFTGHPGIQRIQPVVRSGKIALLPHEKINISMGPVTKGNVDAYLIESISWGGCSGAPTFIDHFDPTATSADPNAVQPFRLLGLINGHHELYADVQSNEESLVGGRVPLNAGIAIVIPAQAILELLTANEVVLTERSDLSPTSLRSTILLIRQAQSPSAIHRFSPDTAAALTKPQSSRSISVTSDELARMEIRSNKDYVALSIAERTLLLNSDSTTRLIGYLKQFAGSGQTEPLRILSAGSNVDLDLMTMQDYVELILFLHLETRVEVQTHILDNQLVPDLISGLESAFADTFPNSNG
ncbi:MAG: hypothetical protein K2Y22_04080 [Candidatus Obscuribacterales bacterium]|nr:hypothetical protein [Candidatus Obscuribacterales bacterium]